jgi:ceramide glucosyltransferase
VTNLKTPAPSLQKLSDPPTGLAGFSPFLAEDNMIASAIMHQLKLSHRMTSDLALDCLGPLTLKGYIARRVRWIRVRKRMTLAATLLEPLTESLLLGIIASWAAHTLCGWPRWLFFLSHELAWIATDLGVLRALNGGGLDGDERMSFLVAWACREALALPIWLKAMVGDTVIWRGVTYRIVGSGEAIKVSE